MSLLTFLFVERACLDCCLFYVVDRTMSSSEWSNDGQELSSASTHSPSALSESTGSSSDDELSTESCGSSGLPRKRYKYKEPEVNICFIGRVIPPSNLCMFTVVCVQVSRSAVYWPS